MTISATDLTVGMEEELFLVEAETMDCVVEMPEPFRREAERALGEHFQREMAASMVELVSSPHATMSSLAREQAALRSEVVRIAERHGLAVLACGTHPLADWAEQAISPGARYEQVVDSARVASVRSHVCGLHVHVAVPEHIDRVAVMSRLRPYLPLLLALSTSSPFWRGLPTGVKSYRTLANNEMPRSGMPSHFADEEDYRRFVEKLQQASLIPDASFVWWAIRPSDSYRTVEMRITDCCTELDDAVAIAGLYRALVGHACQAGAEPHPPETFSDMIIEENRWQAARLGIGAMLVDHTRSAPLAIADLLQEVSRELSETIDWLDVRPQVDHAASIAGGGTSADRQEILYRDVLGAGATSREALVSVCRDIANRTLPASQTTPPSTDDAHSAADH
jgi:carboxylate-amine ligase